MPASVTFQQYSILRRITEMDAANVWSPANSKRPFRIDSLSLAQRALTLPSRSLCNNAEKGCHSNKRCGLATPVLACKLCLHVQRIADS